MWNVYDHRKYISFKNMYRKNVAKTLCSNAFATMKAIVLLASMFIKLGKKN